MPKKVLPGQRPTHWQPPSNATSRTGFPSVLHAILLALGGFIALVIALIVLDPWLRQLGLAPAREASEVTAGSKDAPAPKAAPASTAKGTGSEDKNFSDLPYLHELPLGSRQKSRTLNRAPSAAATLLRSYWMELEGFKHDPKFHVLRFDNPFRYGEWAGKVRALDETTGKALVAEVGVSPGDVLALGEEYLRNKGLRGERSDYLVGRLDAALNPKPLAAGEGTALRATQGCGDIEGIAKSMRALEAGDFQLSDRLISAASCIDLPAGTTVSAPTRRAGIDWAKGGAQRVYLLVRSGGAELWVPQDEILFENK